jgi:hypothetical protein
LEDPGQFGLVAHIEAPAKAHLGDTVPLTVHVTWTSAPHPWLLLPQSSPECSQLSQITVGMEQSNTITGGTQKPEILVQYKMLAKDTGLAHIPALQFQIPVESGTMTLSTQPAQIQVVAPLPYALVGGILAGLMCLACVVILFRKKRLGKQKINREKQAVLKALQDDFILLGNRVNTADTRLWMLDLEQFCLRARKLSGPMSAEQQESLLKLEEAFAQARYGGGPRDAWANKEWWRQVRTIFALNTENEDNNG